MDAKRARGTVVAQRIPMDAVGNVYKSANGSDRHYGKGGRLEHANGVRYSHDEDGLTSPSGEQQRGIAKDLLADDVNRP